MRLARLQPRAPLQLPRATTCSPLLSALQRLLMHRGNGLPRSTSGPRPLLRHTSYSSSPPPRPARAGGIKSSTTVAPTAFASTAVHFFPERFAHRCRSAAGCGTSKSTLPEARWAHNAPAPDGSLAPAALTARAPRHGFAEPQPIRCAVRDAAADRRGHRDVRHGGDVHASGGRLRPPRFLTGRLLLLATFSFGLANRPRRSPRPLQ